MRRTILSIDGGGIRGAASARFLTLVEKELKRHDRDLRSAVDLWAGTSTGAIIAVALATTDLTMETISELYNPKLASIIFTENRGWFELDGINAPKYEGKGKTRVLREYFGSRTLGDVPDGKHALAVAHGVECNHPVVLKSTRKEYRKLRASEVVDASTAAPSYFPSKRVRYLETGDQDWLIDGGVISNNPTVCAMAEALRHCDGTTLDNLQVLSVGTGKPTRYTPGPDSERWGALGWVTKGRIFSLLGNEQVSAYQAMTFCRAGHYIRVNSPLARMPGFALTVADDMDNVSAKNISNLKALGDYWFDHYGEAAVDLLRHEYSGPSLDSLTGA